MSKQPNHKMMFNLQSTDDFPTPGAQKTVQSKTPSHDKKVNIQSCEQTTSNSSEEYQNPETSEKSEPTNEDNLKNKDLSLPKFRPQGQQSQFNSQPRTFQSLVPQSNNPIAHQEGIASLKTNQDSQIKVEMIQISQRQKFVWGQPKRSFETPKKTVTQINFTSQTSKKTETSENVLQTIIRPLVNQQSRPLDQYFNQLLNRYKKYIIKKPGKTQQPQQRQEDRESQQPERNYKVSEFKLANIFQKVVRGKFLSAFPKTYSTHYEYARAMKYTPTVDKVKEIEWVTLGELKILNINLDLNIPSRGGDVDFEQFLAEEHGFKRKTKVYFGNTTDQQRAAHFIEIIKTAMILGVDFILLQEAYQSNIRRLLLNLIYELANSQFAKYFYPQNLQNYEYNRATLILSKHPVRFGQLKFEMKDHQKQDPKKFYFPLQAFCQFEVLVQDEKIQRIGIFNCHLRSNGEKNSIVFPWIMRQQQLDCIYDWGKKQEYDRFFVIGDTNIPSGEKFRNENIQADNKFFDAFDQGFTAIGGTYLYRNERNEVVDERMDRLLMNKECENKTVVEIKYQDVLLKAAEGKKLDKKKMLEKDEDKLTYITLSDHKIMDITICMTDKK